MVAEEHWPAAVRGRPPEVRREQERRGVRAVAASAAETDPDIRLQLFYGELWRRLLCPRGHGENSAYKQGNC